MLQQTDHQGLGHIAGPWCSGRHAVQREQPARRFTTEEEMAAMREVRATSPHTMHVACERLWCKHALTNALVSQQVMLSLLGLSRKLGRCGRRQTCVRSWRTCVAHEPACCNCPNSGILHPEGLPHSLHSVALSAPSPAGDLWPPGRLMDPIADPKGDSWEESAGARGRHFSICLCFDRVTGWADWSQLHTGQ